MEESEIWPADEYPPIGHADVNRLYYGDNLDILRRYVGDESVDLVYLDPPFQSGRDYNVLFERHDTTKAAAQIKAFEDTWTWSLDAERAYQETVERGGDLSRAMQAFRQLLGQSDMMAYLCMMAPRLVELRRVLKPTGSIYLHCDPTASHYLKLLLDSVFLPTRFQNEIVWQRTNAKALSTRRLPNNHDLIFGYVHGDAPVWNADAMFVMYDAENLDEKTANKYRHRDPDGRVYRLDNLINPNPDRPNLTYEFLGVTRVWRWTRDRMEEAYRSGIVVQTRPGGVPQLKRYLDEQRGRPFGDVWTDIPPVNSQAAERLGYPTQKPVALLERILNLASTEDAIVLDPFCGCGTAVHAAQKLGRKWIGIDVTCLATNLIKHRLQSAFGESATYEVVGEPTTLAEAQQLASEDRFQFQCWALGFVGARANDIKRGADRGIDGRLYFHLGDSGGETKQVVFSVKSGGVQVRDVRDLGHVVAREKAEIGVLITLENPSRPMITEAASAGFYESPWGKHAKLQILTIAELLQGKRVDYPAPRYSNVTLRKAKREKTERYNQQQSIPGIAPAQPRPTAKRKLARR